MLDDASHLTEEQTMDRATIQQSAPLKTHMFSCRPDPSASSTQCERCATACYVHQRDAINTFATRQWELNCIANNQFSKIQISDKTTASFPVAETTKPNVRTPNVSTPHQTENDYKRLSRQHTCQVVFTQLLFDSTSFDWCFFGHS